MKTVTVSEEGLKELQDYIDTLENNVEYYKEWARLLSVQRDMAESKVKGLRTLLEQCKAHLPIIINIDENGIN